MFTCEVLLAAVLLTSPKETAVPAQYAGWLEAMRPALLTLAMDAEVLDPREKGFVLGHDVVGDLAMLQGRYQELTRAPLVGEGQRFPDRKLINEFLALNRAYRNQLTARLAQDGVTARAAIADTPGAAHAIARYGTDPVVPPGAQAEAIATLERP